MPKHALWLFAFLLVGCPKRGARLASDLSSTKWEGWINMTSACEDYGYTGNSLKVCMVFGASDGALIGVDVDWDAEQLRPTCDYFLFAGAVEAETITLMRFERAESDDRFRLSRSGTTMVGTFQVHPSCDPWPVQLGLVPTAPGPEATDALLPPEPATPAPESTEQSL
jgi:hypothetical protein